ncbi:MAG: GEVED domain-containing protein [Planctomycetaceae bacterium]
MPATVNLLTQGFAADSKSDLTHAGRDTPSGQQLLPLEIALPEGTGRWAEFSNVSGSLKAGPGWPVAGPDGGSQNVPAGTYGTNVFSARGISGIFADRFLFLAGVFITDGVPVEGTEPERLVVGPVIRESETFSTSLQQSFYIGDGIGQPGVTQRFQIPDNATRMFLGYLDADRFGWPMGGLPPGAYFDNTGTVVGTVSIFREEQTATNNRPTVDPIDNVTVAENSAGAVIGISGISAGESETQPISVTVTSHSDLIQIPLVSYTQGSDTAAVSIVPAPDSDGVGTVSVMISDGGLDNDLETVADNLFVIRTFNVTVTPLLDFGDAPAPYAVTVAEDGARHDNQGPFLGTQRDVEIDGQHSDGADSDGADEDGVSFVSAATQGQPLTFEVTASGAGFLNAWFDMDSDGVFDGPGEQILTNAAVVEGVNTFVQNVPQSAVIGDTYLRFRLTSEEVAEPSPKGLLPDGEVEDYLYSVNISPAKLDPDGNGVAELFTDGILIARYLVNFRGNALTRNAIGADAGRADLSAILPFLNESQDLLDVDGDDNRELFTDGILIARFLAGFRGDLLIRNAVGPQATRATSAEIEAHLNSFLPATPQSPASSSAAPGAVAAGIGAPSIGSAAGPALWNRQAEPPAVPQQTVESGTDGLVDAMPSEKDPDSRLWLSAISPAGVEVTYPELDHLVPPRLLEDLLTESEVIGQ